MLLGNCIGDKTRNICSNQ